VRLCGNCAEVEFCAGTVRARWPSALPFDVGRAGLASAVLGAVRRPIACRSLAGARGRGKLAGVRLSPSRAGPRYASASPLSHRPEWARKMPKHGRALKRRQGVPLVLAGGLSWLTLATGGEAPGSESGCCPAERGQCRREVGPPTPRHGRRQSRAASLLAQSGARPKRGRSLGFAARTHTAGHGFGWPDRHRGMPVVPLGLSVEYNHGLSILWVFLETFLILASRSD